ncbi:MAG TPA: CoA transferase, partial [Candidatus Acidoferrales bacterium]|nr:CoA transferase [Candidatus Acidoferrales bacterium]
RFIALGSIEPQFYALLLEKTGITDPAFQAQMNRAEWPALKAKLAAVIAAKTRDEWCAIMEGSEVCFAPVLTMIEAPQHPHNRHRGTFVEQDGVVQPAPAPRFSRTPSAIQRPPASPGEHTEEALRDWGFNAKELDDLRKCGAI